ncbi:MAG TPA: TadE/TadG family type IV pilus assembly protein [Sphingomicrobium sp.]|nr:TadE/TadG family type IV pilus assembly protein [Sphingomicrobium sp.]
MRDRTGATAAEFGMVLPLLILLLLGIIDAGRYMWAVNKLEKATQMGARTAVVTDLIPTGLATANFGTSLGQGATIPTASFGEASCSSSACTCSGTCPTLTPYDAAAFQRIATRIKLIAPMISDSNITVVYTNSGLGYAGDPNGPDVAPIVTVRVSGVPFTPLIFQFFGGQLAFPTESASLTLEDGAGSTSN